MDERVLERMLVRAVSSVANSPSLIVAAAGLFFASVFWIAVHVVLGHFRGVIHGAIESFSVALSTLPLATTFCLLVNCNVKLRAGETVSIYEMVMVRWTNLIAFFLSSCLVLALEAMAGVVIAFWLGLERVPVFGTLVYLLTSWVPAVLVFCMIAVVAGQIALLLTLGPGMAQKERLDQIDLKTRVRALFEQDFLLRAKVIIIGMIPLFFLIVGALMWPKSGMTMYAEFCATLVRAFVFSLAAAPCFLFLVHMCIEADRYIQWRASRRQG